MRCGGDPWEFVGLEIAATMLEFGFLGASDDEIYRYVAEIVSETEQRQEAYSLLAFVRT